jgi:hypothetical protein
MEKLFSKLIESSSSVYFDCQGICNEKFYRYKQFLESNDSGNKVSPLFINYSKIQYYHCAGDELKLLQTLLWYLSSETIIDNVSFYFSYYINIRISKKLDDCYLTLDFYFDFDFDHPFDNKVQDIVINILQKSLKINYMKFADKKLLEKFSSMISQSKNIDHISFDCDTTDIKFSSNNNIRYYDGRYNNFEYSLMNENVLQGIYSSYQFYNGKISEFEEKYQKFFSKNLLDLNLSGEYYTIDEIKKYLKNTTNLYQLRIYRLKHKAHDEDDNKIKSEQVLLEIMYPKNNYKNNYKSIMIFNHCFGTPYTIKYVDKNYVYKYKNKNIVKYCGENIRENIILRKCIKKRVKYKFFS